MGQGGKRRKGPKSTGNHGVGRLASIRAGRGWPTWLRAPGPAPFGNREGLSGMGDCCGGTTQRGGQLGGVELLEMVARAEQFAGNGAWGPWPPSYRESAWRRRIRPWRFRASLTATPPSRDNRTDTSLPKVFTRKSNSMDGIGTAVVGAGFIGPVHVEALRRLGVPITRHSGCDAGRIAVGPADPRAAQGLRQPRRGAGRPGGPGRPPGRAQRAALRVGQAGAGGRQARDVREAAGHELARSRPSWSSWPRASGWPPACATTSASIR